MNPIIVFVIIAAIAMFFLFWRVTAAITRSEPLDFTRVSGRSRVHNFFRIPIAAMSAFCVLTAVALFLSDAEWFRRLGAGFAFLATGVLLGRITLPQNDIVWDVHGIEGPQFSWRHPIIPKRIFIEWEDIWEVTAHTNGKFVKNKSQSKLIGWTGAYLGYTFLDKYLVEKRPDLFYAPHYIVPIPRKK